MVIDISYLAVAVAFLLPLAVGVVTKEVTNSSVKFILLAALATVTGLVTAALAANGNLAADTIVQSLIALGISVASYYGVWKPTGAAGAVQSATDSAGIGVTIVADKPAS